jgi:hypothetical protein
MDRVKFIEHAGKRILRIDFTDCKPEQLIWLIDVAGKVVRTQPKNSVLAVTLVNGAHFDSAVSQAFKEYAAYNKPFVKASAIVGLAGLQRVLHRGVALFSERQINSFDDEKTAMDWLASQ